MIYPRSTLASIICTIAALASPSTASAATVGHWRFDEADAAAGSELAAAENAVDPGLLDAAATATAPVYSDDVPAAEIFDPVADAVLANGFSLDASAPDARLATPDSPQFNTSFTVEFFVKNIGEPGNYHSFLARTETQDLRWQVDFDHAANLSFGRMRCRWDTPAGAPDDLAEVGVDENVNFVLGPQGGVSAAKTYVDTGAKDEFGADVGPQNTGNPNDYVYDAASANPNETDVALQGDGLNDLDGWHHVAMTFDEASGEIAFYFDYALAQRRTLADTEGDGYTHPTAGLLFGKLTGEGYGLLMDEVRYSNAILTPGQFLRDAAGVGDAETVAHWRMDDAGASEGAAIVSVANAASPLHAATPRSGAPTYSTDVPAPTIYDPVADAFLANGFSLDASGPNARIGAAYDAAFDTSFTVEMFIKLLGEPGGYQSFMRRSQASDLRWQFDFDHANMGAFGRPRARWDTPAGGVPDNVATNGVDENVNFVVGPTGGGNVPDANRLYIDTDPGDGLVASYDDPADWALDGDAANDVGAWRHLAMTFDQETGTVGFFLDHQAMQTRTLSDSEGNGYTHPAAFLDFGKFANAGYGLLIDEVRYSGAVLFPEQFLQAVNAPPEPFEITAFAYDRAAHVFSLEFRSEPGVSYSVDRYEVEFGFWQELDDSLLADDTTFVFDDTTLAPGQSTAMYRVRAQQ